MQIKSQTRLWWVPKVMWEECRRATNAQIEQRFTRGWLECWSASSANQRARVLTYSAGTIASWTGLQSCQRPWRLTGTRGCVCDGNKRSQERTGLRRLARSTAVPARESHHRTPQQQCAAKAKAAAIETQAWLSARTCCRPESLNKAVLECITEVAVHFNSRTENKHLKKPFLRRKNLKLKMTID